MSLKMNVLNFLVPLMVLAFAAMVPFVAARADVPVSTAAATTLASPIQMAAAPARNALDLKTPTRSSRKNCNGKTTSECCAGLSYCTCLYMPGNSSDNHPTACFKGTPPSNG